MINWFYKNRTERSKWLSERFRNEILQSKNILDVGCYKADFKNYIPKNKKYLGIDIAGKPDLFIDLDKIEKLPFETEKFDIVICADVLEHLENIHLIFDELCRVSAKYVIITLPNAYSGIPEFLRGKNYAKNPEKQKQFGKHSKFYGLPTEKPKDRHRWFFSFEEAFDFIKYRCEKFNFKIENIESEHKYEKKKLLRKIFFSCIRKINKNITDKNIIVILKKINNETENFKISKT